MVAGFLHYLTISICFPFIQGVRGKRSLPRGFPMLLERCDSFSPVLNLNQDVSQEASLVCQCSEFFPVKLARCFSVEKGLTLRRADRAKPSLYFTPLLPAN